MKATCTSSVPYLLYPQKNYASNFQMIIDQKGEKAYLIQRIEFLEMENQQLKRRDQNNKKINLALTQAIGRSNYQPQNIKQLISSLFKSRIHQSDRKQHHQKSVQTDIATQQFQKTNYLKQQIQNPECQRYQYPIKDTFKNSFAWQQKDRKHFDDGQNFEFRFSNTRTPIARNLNISGFVSQSCATPIRQRIINDSKKSFQRTQSYLQGPATHRSSLKSTRAKNVATDLLCDICGLSFSPMVFLSHVQECEGDNEESEDLRRITDADFSQQENNDDGEQLVQLLESRKKKLSIQIQKLKKMRGSPGRKKRLETDLDQIVFIIKNKKTLNNSDIKRLLKQKNQYEKYFR